MATLLDRMAGPPTLAQGLRLAFVAAAMTAAPLLATAWFWFAAQDGDHDYAASNVVLLVTWTLAYLGIIPLMFAIIALLGRAVRPSWLVPTAVALALCQPIATVLAAAGALTIDYGLAFLLAITTGSAVGVLAAGLGRAGRPTPVGMTVLVAIGVSIAATAVTLVIPTVVLAIAVAILIGVVRSRGRAPAPPVARETTDGHD
jgi:peptidoglycan/LPS O-acetylase OafA/YrhL